ncbi:MAG: rhodanese-like domain-containing protein [Candidatus Kryptonium sp.]
MKARYKALAILFILVYLFGCTVQNIKYEQRGYLDVSPSEAWGKMNKSKNVLILDVRTVGEFSEEHIKGAINIPVQEIGRRLNELKKHKNYEIIVYCRSGNRSKRASEILVKNGFKHVYNLTGGIIEWKKYFEVGK